MDNYQKGDKVRLKFESGGTIISGMAEVKNSSNKYYKGIQTDIRIEMKEVNEPGYMSGDGKWLCTGQDIAYKLCDSGHDLMYHDRKDEWYCPFCEDG